MQNKNPLSSAKIGLDKVIMIVVVLTCVLTSTVMLGPRVLEETLTEEEAVEISMNRPAVEIAFSYRRYDGFGELILEIQHWNTTYIKSIKEEYAYMGTKNPYGFLPDDHGAWKLFWSIDSTHILHWIDDLTGQIIGESSLRW